MSIYIFTIDLFYIIVINPNKSSYILSQIENLNTLLY